MPSHADPDSPTTVLLVDDSAYWTDTIADGLRREGYVVAVLHDGLAAVERLRTAPPHILITDYYLANLDGGKLCQVAKRVATDPPIVTIILTGGADRNLSRVPSVFADAVIAKNAPEIVFGDLRRALVEVAEGHAERKASGKVIGHERLHPRAIAVKLQGLKQYLDALHEGIGDAVIGVDSKLRVHFVNSTAVELFDLKEQDVLARPAPDVLSIGESHDLVRAIRDALGGGDRALRPQTVEIKGSVLRVTVAGLKSPDGRATALIIARDISDLKAAEQARAALDARLHEADKMASLGHLVAGVSHEINNPLAAILLNLNSLAERVPRLLSSETGGKERPANSQEISERLAEMQHVLQESAEAAERIRTVVADMRVFSHSSNDAGEQTNVEDLLDGALSLVANEVRFKARIIRNYNRSQPVIADRTRLSQAFLNIVLNAAQAIEGNSPEDNWIRVETGTENDGILVSIANSGPPIAKEHLPKIFDPFFTTKQVGQGVGLGLSIAYETVRRHGGYIEARSDDSAPTTFRVWLPLDTGLVLRPHPEPSEPRTRQAASVLIVDDDKLFRNSLRRILEKYYDVSVAPNGERAAELLAERRYDAVLCDLIMPRVTGMDLYETIVKRSPEQGARFVFLTGGTNSPEARDFLLNVKNPRAYKPVNAIEIIDIIDQCLKDFSSA
jgi:PAS domain S-box-containing protein